MWWVLLWMVLLILAIAALPVWPHTSERGWGYYPSGVLSMMLMLLLLFWFVGLIAL